MKAKLTLAMFMAFFFSISAYTAPGGKPNKDDFAADITSLPATVADLNKQENY